MWLFSILFSCWWVLKVMFLKGILIEKGEIGCKKNLRLGHV